jgi:putative flippase GtrA
MSRYVSTLVENAARWSRVGWRQVLAFGVVSVATTVLDFALFNVLVFLDVFGVVVANTISYGTGVIASYALNKFVTFAGRGREKRAHELGIFIGINIAGLALNNGAVGVAEALAGESVLLLNLAKLAAGTATWVAKFLLFKRWVYPSRSEMTGESEIQT